MSNCMNRRARNELPKTRNEQFADTQPDMKVFIYIIHFRLEHCNMTAQTEPFFTPGEIS